MDMSVVRAGEVCQGVITTASGPGVGDSVATASSAAAGAAAAVSAGRLMAHVRRQRRIKAVPAQDERRGLAAARRRLP